MLHNYRKSKEPIVNHSFQAKIHQHFNPDYQFNTLKHEDYPEPVYEDLKKMKYNGKVYYSLNPDICYEVLSNYTNDQLQSIVDEQRRGAQKYLTQLAKFNQISEKELEVTLDQYENVIFINGLGFDVNYIISFYAQDIKEEIQAEVQRQTDENIPQDKDVVQISCEAIRKVTRYTYTPVVFGKKQYVEWQHKLLNDTNRYVYIVGSRQIGKSYVIAELFVEESFKYNQKMLICAFESDTTNIIQNYILELTEGFTQGTFVQYKKQNYIENTYSKSRIYFRSLSDGANRIRGHKFNLIGIDESAFVDNDIYEKILKPTTITTQGRIIAFSSPDTRNWFYYKTIEAKKGVKNSSLYEVDLYQNPFIDDETKAELIEKYKKGDPIVANEYFCKFAGGENQLFMPNYLQSFPALHPLGYYVIGYDPARKGKDRSGYTVFYIYKGKATVIESGFIPDRFKGQWETQAKFLKEIQDRYQAELVVDVTGSGDGVVNILKMQGLKVSMVINYTGSNTVNTYDSEVYRGTEGYKVGKTRLIQNALDMLSEKHVNIFEYTNKDLIEEFNNIQMVKKITGIGMNSEFYDDITNAFLVGCYYIFKKNLLSKEKLEYKDDKNLWFGEYDNIKNNTDNKRIW